MFFSYTNRKLNNKSIPPLKINVSGDLAIDIIEKCEILKKYFGAFSLLMMETILFLIRIIRLAQFDIEITAGDIATKSQEHQITSPCYL